MARKSSREAILDAAERVVAEHGIANTSVEAVAAEAGVSKGGLFYHFASKKDLLLQLIARHETRFIEYRDEIMAALPPSPNRLLKATLLASIDHPARKTANVSNLAAMLGDNDLRGEISVLKRKLFQSVVEGARHPEMIALALLVTDGLWLMEVFGTSFFDAGFKKRVVAELMNLIDQYAVGTPDDGGGRPRRGEVKEKGKAGRQRRVLT